MHVYLFKTRSKELVQVHLNEPTSQFDDTTDNNDSDDQMTVEVMGDMPKVIGFEQESIIQVLLTFLFYLYFIQ